MEVMVKKDLFFVADSVIFKPNRTEEEILEFPKLMILALLVGSCQDPIHIWVVFVLEGPNEGTIQLYRECRNQPSEYNKIGLLLVLVHTHLRYLINVSINVLLIRSCDEIYTRRGRTHGPICSLPGNTWLYIGVHKELDI